MTPDLQPANEQRADRFWDLLDPAQRAVVQRAGVRHGHPAGTVLLREGEPAESVLILLSGRVKVVAVGASGHQGLLAIRRPGDILGELAAVDNRPRSATVVASESVDVLRVLVPDFIDILKTHAAIAYALLRVVSTRLRVANLRRVENGETTVAQRVAITLAELAVDHGTLADGTVDITLPLSQDELAMMVGASREAVVRALRVLRSEGIINTGRQRITLLRPDVLGLRAQGRG